MKHKAGRMTMLPLVILFVHSVVVVLPAEEIPQRLFLWETWSGEAHIYLAGSIHILNEDFYPLPDPINHAVEQSDFLILEADVSSMNPEEINTLIVQYGMYRDGSDLADHIPEKLYDDVVSYSIDHGLTENQIRLMRPWLLSLTLQALSEVFAGYDASLGMEMVLADRFESEQIMELEGAAFQVRILSSLSHSDQLILLESVLDESVEQRQQMINILDAWKNGEDRIIQELIDDLDDIAHSLNRKLITERNIRMVDRILDMTGERTGTYFVLVGTAHFVGEEGLPSLLIRRGLPMNRVLNDGSTTPQEM